jgi:hypothetical protein
VTTNHNSPKSSIAEADLLAIMQADRAVLRARADEADDLKPERKRVSPSVETRAKLAAAASRRKLSAETRAKISATQRKLRSQPATSPGTTRRAAHG